MNKLFYKDATPRGEHFMQCVVKLIGREHETESQRRVIPLKLTLCYDDGQPIEAIDHSSLRILSSNSHLKAAIPAAQDHVAFSYRIELGSFRRADRSFAVRVEADADSQHRPANYLAPSRCRDIEPCMTPAVYVLSKKKITDSTNNGPPPNPAVQLGGGPIGGAPRQPVVPPSAQNQLNAHFNPAAGPRQQQDPFQYGAMLKRKYPDDGYDDSIVVDHQLARLRWSGTQEDDGHSNQQIIQRLNAIESQVSQLASIITKFTGAIEQMTQLPNSQQQQQQQQQQQGPLEPPPNSGDQHFYPQPSPRSTFNVNRLIPTFNDDPGMMQRPGSPTQHHILQQQQQQQQREHLMHSAAPSVQC